MDDADKELADFSLRLGHEFGNRALLRDALTHRSFANERAHQDNERMEFLGDAVLGHAVSILLYEAFPDASEGELTRRRADLVCAPALAELARAIDLGAALRLGHGEERSGGRDKPRLLASAFEACVAAVYLDAQFEGVLALARRLLAPLLSAEVLPGEADHKSRLQEMVQRAGGPAPTYVLVSSEGPSHARSFVAAVHIDGRERGIGSGRSKAAAEQAAAQVALENLRTDGDL